MMRVILAAGNGVMSHDGRYGLTHVFKNQVNVLVVVGPVNVQQADNIWMIAKVLQEHDFTKSPLRVRLVAEGVCIDQSANTKHVTIPFEIGPLANRLRLTGSYPPHTHTHIIDMLYALGVFLLF